MPAYTEGKYVARLNTETSLDRLAELYAQMQTRGMKFESDAERAMAFVGYKQAYYRSIPSMHKGIFGITASKNVAIQSIARSLSKFPKPEGTAVQASVNVVNSGIVNALLKAASVDVLSLKKKQSGSELVKGVIATDEKIRIASTYEFAVLSNMQEQLRAYNRISETGMRYMNFDYEDIGDQITQYSFNEFDMSDKDAEDAKLVKDSERSGLIGIDRKTKSEADSLIDTYRNHQLANGGKVGVAEKDEYKLRELMKAGLVARMEKNGEQVRHIDKDGRIVLDKYVSNEDAQHYDADIMQEGADWLYGINKEAKTHMATLELGGQKFQMYRYEADILGSYLRASKADPNSIVMTSTNGLAHDIPISERMLGKNGSAGAQAFIKAFTHGSGLIGDNIWHFDVTAVGRELISDQFILKHPEAAALAAQLRESVNSATGHMFMFLGKEGRERIRSMVEGMLGDVGKHTSRGDTYSQGFTFKHIYKKIGELAKERYDQLVDQARKRGGEYFGDMPTIFDKAGQEFTPQAGSLFYIDDGMFAKNGSPISFTQDAVSGEIRFANNVRVGRELDANGNRRIIGRSDIVSAGMKKNTVAMLLNAPTKLDFDSDEGRKILGWYKQMGYEPPGTELWTMTFATYGEREYGGKRNLHTFIGTKDEAVRFLQKNPHVGEISRESVEREMAHRLDLILGKAKEISEWEASYQVISDRLAENRAKLVEAAKNGMLGQNPSFFALDGTFDETKFLSDPLFNNIKVEYAIEGAKLNSEREDALARIHGIHANIRKVQEQFFIDHPGASLVQKKLKKIIDDAWEEKDEVAANYAVDRKTHKANKAERDAAKEDMEQASSNVKKLRERLKNAREKEEKLRKKAKKHIRFGVYESSPEVHDYQKQQGIVETIENKLRDAVVELEEKRNVYRAVQEKVSIENDILGWVSSYNDTIDDAQKKGLKLLAPLQEMLKPYWEELEEANASLDEINDRYKEYSARRAEGGVVSDEEWKELGKKSTRSEYRVEPTEESLKAVRQETKDWDDARWLHAMFDPNNHRAVDTEHQDKRTKKYLSSEITDKDGNKRIGYRLRTALETATEYANRDAASNWVRDMDYKKSFRILNFLRASSKFASGFFGFDPAVMTAQQREQVTDSIIGAFRFGKGFDDNISIRLFGSLDSEQGPVTFDKLTKGQQKAYRRMQADIGRLMRSGEDYSLLSNTLKQLSNTAGWSSGMETVIRTVKGEVDRLAAGTKDKGIREQAYKYVWNNTIASLTLQARDTYGLSLDSQDAIGKSPRDYKIENGKVVEVESDRVLPRLGRQLDSFEVPLVEILKDPKIKKLQGIGSAPVPTFTIDLSVRKSFGKQLASAMNLRPDKPEQVMTALRALGVSIYHMYGRGDEDFEKDLKGLLRNSSNAYAPDFAASLIRTKLRSVRKKDKTIGLPQSVTLAETDRAPVAIRLMHGLHGEDPHQEEWWEEHVKQTVKAAAEGFVPGEEKRSSVDLAEYYMKNYLFSGTEGITAKDLMKYGHSEAEANAMLEDRKLRKAETKELLTTIFDNTFNWNGSPEGYRIYDDGTFHLTLADGQYLDITKYMPFDTFNRQTGSFYTKVNNRYIAAVKMLADDTQDEDAYDVNLGVHTVIGRYKAEADKQMKRVHSLHRTAERNLSNTDYFLRESLDPIVNSTITKFDRQQDAKLGRSFDISKFFDRLGFYWSKGAYDDVRDTLSESTIKTLEDLAYKASKNADRSIETKPNTSQLISLYGNDFYRLIAPLGDVDSKLSQLVFNYDKDAAQYFADRIFKNLKLNGLKHPEDGLISLSDEYDVPLGNFGFDYRHINQALARAHNLQSVDEFRELLGRDSDLGGSTILDSIVRTGQEQRAAEHGQKPVRSVLTTHLSINQTEWEKFLAERDVQDALFGEFGEYANQFRTYLNESGALANGAFLELMPKNIEQKARTNELIDAVKMAAIIGREDSEKEAELRNRTNELIEVVKGKVSYRYSDDYVFLDKGDVMMRNESFKGTASKILAERGGFLQKRYYNNGRLVSEEEISAVLNRAENVKRLEGVEGRPTGTGENLSGAESLKYETALQKYNARLRTEVGDILREEGYSQFYRLESPDALQYRKIILDTEKAYTHFATMPLGAAVGSRVPEILGLSKEILAGIPAEYLTMGVLRSPEKMNALLAHYHLPRVDYNPDDLAQAVEEDQKHFWDSLNYLLRDKGYIDESTYVNVISARDIEAAKEAHQVTSNIPQKINGSVDFLARAMADGKAPTAENYAEASKAVQNALSGVFIGHGKDGKAYDTLEQSGGLSFSIGDPDEIDVDKLNRALARFNPDFARYGEQQEGSVVLRDADGNVLRWSPDIDNGKKRKKGGYDAPIASVDIKVGDEYRTVSSPYRYDENGKLVSKVDFTQMFAADDADEGRINEGDERGIKVSRRMTAALQQETAHEEGLLKVFESVKARDRYEREILGRDSSFAVDRFNQMYKGEASAVLNDKGELMLNVERDASGVAKIEGKSVNAGIIRNMHEEVVAGTESSIQFMEDGANNDRLFRQLSDKGIKRQDAEAILDELYEKGYKRVGLDYVEKQYANASGHLAQKFNQEMLDAGTDKEKQQEILERYKGYGLLGDEVIDITNVSLEQQFGQNDANNLLQRAGIIKVDDRYVAVGFERTPVMDNQDGTGIVSRTSTRKALSDLQHLYDPAYNESPYKDEAQKNIDNAYNSLIHTQSKGVTAKEGALAETGEGYMKGSMMFKANIIRTKDGGAFASDFMNGETHQIDDILERAKIGDVSISELERNGTHVNAMFVGRDFFHNMVYDDEFGKALNVVLGREATEEDKKGILNMLLDRASERGGIGVELRQPMEYYDSVQGVHIFYDKNLSSNEALITESMAQGQKADKDGDTIFAALARTEASVGSLNSGELQLENVRLNQQQIMLLNMLKGGMTRIDIADGGEGFRQIEKAADYVANGTLGDVHPLDEGNSLADAFWQHNGFENLRVGNKIYRASNYAPDEIVKFQGRTNEILQSDSFRQFAADRGVDVTSEKFQSDFIHNAVEFKNVDGETAHLISEYAAQNLSEEADRRALGVTISATATSDEIAKTMARSNTGLVNMHTHRLRTLVNDLKDAGATNFQSGDELILAKLITHINEAGQAPKNASATNQFDASELSEAIEGLFGVGYGPSNQRQNLEPMRDFIEKMKAEGIKELKREKLPEIAGLQGFYDESGEISTDRIMRMFERILPQGKVISRAVYNQQRLGYYLDLNDTAKADTMIESYASHNENDLRSTSDTILNRLMQEHGAEDQGLREDMPLLVESREMGDVPERNFGRDERFTRDAVNGLAGDIDDVVRGTFRTVGAALHSGGAKMMLGFAGAMMMAGTVAGAPTSPTPAQGQAQGIQSENAMYEMPSAVPSATTKSQPQSYIINVNASTSRGRDFATAAINQAMASMQQTSNGNQMTMNIKDSSSNIGFGDIANYVSGML